MAIVDYINLGYDLQIVVADADPRSSGVDVPKGSLVLLNDGTGSFFKSGTLSTDWSLSILGATTTANYIPKFTATGVIGNSNISMDVSNNLYIGTANVTIGDGITGYSLMQSASENKVLKYSASTNAVIESLKIESVTSGTPAVGIGTSLSFSTETSTVATKIGSVISSVTTNVGTGTEAFDLAFANMTAGATATERMRITSAGQIKFNAYTSATSFTGTPIGTLMANSSGNLILQETAFQVTSLNISAAAVLGAFASPITLVASQGAGKIIVPHALVFFLNSAGTAFATNTNYAWGLGATLITGTKSFAGTTDIYHIDTATLTSGGTAIQNAPLTWRVQTGAPTGGTGATISLGVVYSVMTIS